jgi:hypothetical protein
MRRRALNRIDSRQGARDRGYAVSLCRDQRGLPRLSVISAREPLDRFAGIPRVCLRRAIWLRRGRTAGKSRCPQFDSGGRTTSFAPAREPGLGYSAP